uniref:Uncharacterized protein n=1 Tax=Setaria italica TaxID=4555 RepID=K3ZF02_SETIT
MHGASKLKDDSDKIKASPTKSLKDFMQNCSIVNYTKYIIAEKCQLRNRILVHLDNKKNIYKETSSIT